jgi:hypothetical protein
MGCDARHEMRALHSAFPRDRYIAVGQVAQTAVDELAGPTRCAECEVIGFDQCHVEATTRGVQGRTAAGDATTDHENIDDMAGTEAL